MSCLSKFYLSPRLPVFMLSVILAYTSIEDTECSLVSRLFACSSSYLKFLFYIYCDSGITTISIFYHHSLILSIPETALTIAVSKIGQTHSRCSINICGKKGRKERKAQRRKGNQVQIAPTGAPGWPSW